MIGLIAPVAEIFELAKKYGSYTVLDMSQTAGLVDCDVGRTTFDFGSVCWAQNTVWPDRNLWIRDEARNSAAGSAIWRNRI